MDLKFEGLPEFTMLGMDDYGVNVSNDFLRQQGFTDEQIGCLSKADHKRVKEVLGNRIFNALYSVIGMWHLLNTDIPDISTNPRTLEDMAFHLDYYTDSFEDFKKYRDILNQFLRDKNADIKLENQFLGILNRVMNAENVFQDIIGKLIEIYRLSFEAQINEWGAKLKDSKEA